MTIRRFKYTLRALFTATTVVAVLCTIGIYAAQALKPQDMWYELPEITKNGPSGYALITTYPLKPKAFSFRRFTLQKPKAPCKTPTQSIQTVDWLVGNNDGTLDENERLTLFLMNRPQGYGP